MVAVKHFHSLFSNEIDAFRVLRELAIMSALHHPCITELYYVVEPDDPDCFDSLDAIMELSFTDLYSIIKAGKTLSMSQVKQILYQTLCGLNHMHSAGVLHRDLKPANILVGKNLGVKLCDFNLSREVNVPLDPSETVSVAKKRANLRLLLEPLTDHVVTRWYRAPELILLSPAYDDKIDVWSAGCILGELLSLLPESTRKGPLFPGHSCYPLSPYVDESTHSPRDLDDIVLEEGDQLNTILKWTGMPNESDLDFLARESTKEYVANFPQHPRQDATKQFPRASKEAIDLLHRTLEFSPDKRISVSEALGHPLFSGMRDPLLERRAHGVASFQFGQLGTEKRLRRAFMEEIRSINSQRGTNY